MRQPSPRLCSFAVIFRWLSSSTSWCCFRSCLKPCPRLHSFGVIFLWVTVVIIVTVVNLITNRKNLPQGIYQSSGAGSPNPSHHIHIQAETAPYWCPKLHPQDEENKVEKRGCVSRVNKNVGIVICMLDERTGTGGVGNVPIHARIAAMSARGKIVVLGKIVERLWKWGKLCPRVSKSAYM